MEGDRALAPRTRTAAILFAILLLLAIGFRLALVLRHPYRCVDSDEAISGIMAMHILEGRELPVFFYGQPYGGALEAYLAAGLFAVFGASAVGLKMVSLSFFLLFFVAFYLYARDRAGAAAALIGCAYISFPPPYFTEFSFKAGGMYATTFFFGTTILLLTDRASRPGAKWKTHFLLGLVGGVAIWTHLLAVVYVVPALLTLYLRRGRGPFLRSLLPMGLGVLPGLLPLLIYNVAHGGETAGFIGARIGLSSAQKRFWDVFGEGGPTILGMREHLDPQVLYPGVGWLAGCVWAVCLGVYLYRGVGIGREEGRWKWDRARIDPGALMLLILPFILAPTGFQVFAANPRYMAPAYSVLPLALGSVATLAWAFRRWSRCLLILGAAVLLVLHVWGNLDRWKGGLLWKDREADHREIVQALQAREIRQVFTNYWIGYRLALESGGEVVPSPFHIGFPGEFPSQERYPPFTQEVRAGEASNYLLWRDQSRIFNDLVLANSDGSAREVEFIGPFALFAGVRPAGPYASPGVLMEDKTSFRTRLPEEGGAAGALLDSDLDTAWQTRGPVPDGAALDILLPEALPLSGLDVALRIHLDRSGPVDLGGGLPVPIPEGLRVLVSADGETFEEVVVYKDRKAIIDEALVNARPIRSSPYRIFVPLDGIRGRVVRIEILSSPRWPWEIAELDVYRSP